MTFLRSLLKAWATSLIFLIWSALMLSIGAAWMLVAIVVALKGQGVLS